MRALVLVNPWTCQPSLLSVDMNELGKARGKMCGPTYEEDSATSEIALQCVNIATDWLLMSHQYVVV
jgi:hypothetical protein